MKVYLRLFSISLLIVTIFISTVRAEQIIIIDSDGLMFDKYGKIIEENTSLPVETKKMIRNNSKDEEFSKLKLEYKKELLRLILAKNTPQEDELITVASTALRKLMEVTCYDDEEERFIEKTLLNFNNFDEVENLLNNPRFKSCIERSPELIESVTDSGDAPKTDCKAEGCVSEDKVFSKEVTFVFQGFKIRDNGGYNSTFDYKIKTLSFVLTNVEIDKLNNVLTLVMRDDSSALGDGNLKLECHFRSEFVSNAVLNRLKSLTMYNFVYLRQGHLNGSLNLYRNNSDNTVRSNSCGNLEFASIEESRTVLNELNKTADWYGPMQILVP